jgi:hypothetical protein
MHTRRPRFAPLLAVALAATVGSPALAAITIDIGVAGAAGPSGKIHVPISLSGAAEAGGVQVDVLFPNTVLRMPADPTASCEVPEAVPGSVYWTFLELPDDPPGTSRMRLAFVRSASTAYDSGPLATCTFTVAADAAAGTYALPGAGAKASDPDGQALPALVHSGAFTVCSGCCP